MLSYKYSTKNIVGYLADPMKSVETERRFSFAKNTTYGLGGEATVAYYPKNLVEAQAVYSFLERKKFPFVTLGNGSNVLASSKPYNGAVVCLKKLKGIVRCSPEVIFVLAGTTVSELLSYCKSKCLGGLEYLYKIPATVGGIAFMNGGAGGKYVQSNVVAVKIFKGKINNLPVKKCNYGYKYSTMQDVNTPVLGVYLSVLPKSREEIEDELFRVKTARAHLPKGRSCGCVFKNGEDYSAGKIIDEAGLKGVRIGGAFVSERHANFIISDGGTAEDVASLIKFVKHVVFVRYGVELKEELRYIGEFNETDG